MKNSYFKALSGLFALCALLVGGGCDDSDSEVNEKPYAISVSQNEMAAYYTGSPLRQPPEPERRYPSRSKSPAKTIT